MYNMAYWPHEKKGVLYGISTYKSWVEVHSTIDIGHARGDARVVILYPNHHTYIARIHGP